MKRLSLVLLALVVIVGSCSDDSSAPSFTSTTETPVTSATLTSTTASPSTTGALDPPEAITPPRLNLVLEAVPLWDGDPWAGPQWPGNVTDVGFVEFVPTGLRADLATHGFVIEPSSQPHLAWVYDNLYPYGGRAVFVTTDSAYHQWHLVFDSILRRTETDVLLPMLEQLVLGLLGRAEIQAAELEGTAIEDEAIRVVDHLQVVAEVLELGQGTVLSERAAAELDLVMQHTEWVGSPTVGGDCEFYPGSCVDYSLMTPRGHYTRTPELTRYFRAMSMLGNTSAAIADTDAMRFMALLARVLITDQELAGGWARIYDSTAFLVGNADDYTPFELGEAVNSVAGNWLQAPDGVQDADLAGVRTVLLGMRPVRIDPALASVRTMGARFVFDSYVYDQLTDPAVPDRTRVQGLDLASVLGSDWALQRQDDAGNTALPAYSTAIQTLRNAASARTMSDWGATAYDAWLWALQAVWSQYGDEFPPFMRGDAWAAKSHQTGLGSYTELKHDTILYAKQGIAEGDMEPPPTLEHWVEPDPVAFMRLAGAARLLYDGLDELGLLPGVDDEQWTPRGLLRQVIDLNDRLGAIARAELTGQPVSPEDNWFLGGIGSQFEMILMFSTQDAIDPHGGLVADVFLDPLSDSVLELGTGDFDLIHVVVPDRRGGFQVATGGVYAYYEFWQPRAERLDDETWWGLIEDGTLPDRPWWIEEYLGL